MNSRRVRVEFMCFMIIVKLVIFAKVVGCQQFRAREVVNICRISSIDAMGL